MEQKKQTVSKTNLIMRAKAVVEYDEDYDESEAADKLDALLNENIKSIAKTNN